MMLAKNDAGMRTMMAIIAIAIISILYSISATASSTGTTVHYIINTTTTYGVNLTQPANQTINSSNDAVYIITVTNNGSAIDSFTLTFDNLNNASTAVLNQTVITNLPPNSSFNVTLTIGDINPGNYTAILTATSQGDNNSYQNVSVTTEVIPNALIINTLINPYAVINGSNVTLYIDAENHDAVWAVLTRPDNTTENVTLTDEANTIYTNTNLTGTYNVTFYANNSLGEVVSVDDYFEVFTGIIIDLDVIDSNATGINSTFISYYRNGSVAINSSAIGKYIVELANALLDTKFYAHNNKITVTLWGQNISDMHNKYIGIDRHNQTTGYIITYGVEPEWTATNATLRIYYDDLNYTDESRLNLYKCANYNFTGRQCLGSWADVTGQADQDTAQDYFEIDLTGFSGFSIREDTTIPPTICAGCGGGGGGGDTEKKCYENWACRPWNPCFNGQQTRDCVDVNNCGTDEYKPDMQISCFIPCYPEWECGEWSKCSDASTQTRVCADAAGCGTRRGMPATEQHCAYDSCSDSVQNNGEDGVDCGGNCPPCAVLERPRLWEFAESNILCMLLIILEMVLFVMLIMLRAAKMPRLPTKALAIVNVTIMIITLILMIPTRGCPGGLCNAIADTMPIIDEILLFFTVMFAIVLTEAVVYFIIKRLMFRHVSEKAKGRKHSIIHVIIAEFAAIRRELSEGAADLKAWMRRFVNASRRRRRRRKMRHVRRMAEKKLREEQIENEKKAERARKLRAEKKKEKEQDKDKERLEALKKLEAAEKKVEAEKKKEILKKEEEPKPSYLEKMHHRRMEIYRRRELEKIIKSYEEEMKLLLAEIEDDEKDISSAEIKLKKEIAEKKHIITSLQPEEKQDTLEKMASTHDDSKHHIELMVHHVLDKKMTQTKNRLEKLREHKRNLTHQYDDTKKALNKTRKQNI